MIDRAIKRLVQTKAMKQMLSSASLNEPSDQPRPKEFSRAERPEGAGTIEPLAQIACQRHGAAGAAWVFTGSSGIWSQPGHKLVGAVGSARQGMAVALSADWQQHCLRRWGCR